VKHPSIAAGWKQLKEIVEKTSVLTDDTKDTTKCCATGTCGAVLAAAPGAPLAQKATMLQVSDLVENLGNPWADVA